jgi:hypothetical protein
VNLQGKAKAGRFSPRIRLHCLPGCSRSRTISQIGFFFASYNKLYGKQFKVLGTGGPEMAEKLIRRAIKTSQKGN